MQGYSDRLIIAATEVQTKGGSAIYYAGIDYHKRYSVISSQDEKGLAVQEQRVDHAFPELFARLFGEYREPVAVVYESTVNWSWLYDILRPP
ncbi:MAG TPA: hypothetical protein PLU87_20240 [Sedimentisphaerales bacterium]|nr:hypothetical protein [Sedimentisphaerales bacterium]HRS11292.1 hypothetical protein [Sedimentisphaerales bacterium]HRV49991.1 hypothetical protein [Sedimentisphaerales bacterium]